MVGFTFAQGTDGVLHHLRKEVFVWLRHKYSNLALVFLSFSLAGPEVGCSDAIFSPLIMVSTCFMHRFAIRQMAIHYPSYVKATVTAVIDSLSESIVSSRTI